MNFSVYRHRPLSYSIPQGIGSRWTYGAIILTHLIVYNETGGIGAVLVIIVAAFNALLSGKHINK